MSAHSPAVRPPAVAGQFYPADPAQLRLLVEDLLNRAPDTEVEGVVHGLVAPHAGYPYSGQTAAAAYRQLRGRFYDAAVVLAPSHREPCGGASVFDGEAYETPLGPVPTDRDLARALQGPDIRLSRAGHGLLFSSGLRGEHAIEVHLPFLQAVLPGLPVVPVVMDSRNPEFYGRFAETLVRAGRGRRVLLVASSDLYHGPDLQACLRQDAATLDEIERFSPDGFTAGLRAGSVQACGAGPIAVLMRAARAMGATRATVVASSNSADVTGPSADYVVGYGAVLFLEETPPVPASLDAADRIALGRIAREAVRYTVRGRCPPPPALTTPGLNQSLAAFVTLQVDGRLRGCIGSFQPGDPLGLTVQNMAVAAACRDPRFLPLQETELDRLEVEISVLSPLRRTPTPAEIEVGRHGLLVRKGQAQGLLLPQVAVRQGWDRLQFLAQACRKAGLPPDAWQHPDTELLVFSAEVFPV